MTAEGRPRDERETGWEAHRREKLVAGLALTPAQRLAWLEEAIAFAHRAGALPRRPTPPTGRDDTRSPERRI